MHAYVLNVLMLSYCDIIIIIFGAMLNKQNYPIYRHCIFQTLSKHKDQLISIVGKVTQIDPQSQTLTLQVIPGRQKPKPRQSQSIKVKVPEFEVNYLFDRAMLKTIVDKQDLQRAEKFINYKSSYEKIVVQVENKEDNTYTSLTWYTVEEDAPEPSLEENDDLEQRRNRISAASLVKTITVDEFNLNQYIEVRGKCIDERTVEMRQFTDFQQSFDLASHNYSLAIGLQYCDKIL